MPTASSVRTRPGIREMTYRSRIVGHRDADPASLVPHPQNWRRHPEPQKQALDGALSSVGWLQEVIVNRRTGLIIDGHARVELAIQNEQPTVPIVEVDLDEDEEKLALATFDPLGAMAETDGAQLAELIEGLDEDLADVVAMLHKPAPKVTGNPDYVPPEPEEPIAKEGDIWIVGDHRIMCGDSTNEEHVRALCTEPTETCVTDPPYGVNYDPAWRARHWRGAIATLRVKNDDEASWTRSFALSGADVIYAFCAPGPLQIEAGLSLIEAGYDIRMGLVWSKGFVISRGHYNVCHEHIWYAVKKGATARWTGQNNARTVIEARSKIDTGVSVQKPVEVIRALIDKHEGDVVYDPFLGSGTAIIAAHMEGRRAFGMELNPVFVDIAVKRCEEVLGLDARKEG